MPILDRERGTVVVRVVYDGPPRSGKTTSMEALAGALSGRRKSEIFTPETASGRTLYFDWLDYTGGLMGGYQVRCQIVSVPGQRELAARRAYLLASADVVIFVADATPEGLPETIRMFRELSPVLAGGGDVPVGVVVQTNKRDLPGSLPLAELRSGLSVGPNVALLESVATESRGVREAFVFAIRLALDRVRHLMQHDALAVGRPEVESGLELLGRMRAAEAEGSALHQLLRETLAVEREPEPAPVLSAEELFAASEQVPEPDPPAAVLAAEPLPALPASDIPSGLVWPPVVGRVLLAELPVAQIAVVRSMNGDWSEGTPGTWRVLSRPSGRFASLEDGRRALIQLARLHTAFKDRLSDVRGVALSATGHGEWRLWQIVRREATLRDLLERVDELPRPSEIVTRLFAIAGLLDSAQTLFAVDGMRLPVTLDTLAANADGPRFVEFLPDSERLRGFAPSIDPPRERLRRLLKPQFDDLIERGALATAALIPALQSFVRLEPGRREHGELIAELLGA